MALALRRVAAERGPPIAAAGRRLVSDFSSVTAEAQERGWRLKIERELKEQVAEQTAIRYALAVRGRLPHADEARRPEGAAQAPGAA